MSGYQFNVLDKMSVCNDHDIQGIGDEKAKSKIIFIVKNFIILMEREAKKGEIQLRIPLSAYPHDANFELIKDLSDISEQSKKIITSLFLRYFDIKCDYRDVLSPPEWSLVWKSFNPILPVKPSIKWEKPKESSLNEYCVLLFNNPIISDISIIVEGQHIYAHKFILFRCSYFENIFKNKWKESNDNKIEIKECEYDVFLKFIYYLYSDEICPKFLLDFDNCIKLILLADRFISQSLVSECLKALVNFLPGHLREIESLENQIVNTHLMPLCNWYKLQLPVTQK